MPLLNEFRNEIEHIWSAVNPKPQYIALFELIMILKILCGYDSQFTCTHSLTLLFTLLNWLARRTLSVSKEIVELGRYFTTFRLKMKVA